MFCASGRFTESTVGSNIIYVSVCVDVLGYVTRGGNFLGHQEVFFAEFLGHFFLRTGYFHVLTRRVGMMLLPNGEMEFFYILLEFLCLFRFLLFT